MRGSRWHRSLADFDESVRECGACDVGCSLSSGNRAGDDKRTAERDSCLRIRVKSWRGLGQSSRLRRSSRRSCCQASRMALIKSRNSSATWWAVASFRASRRQRRHRRESFSSSSREMDCKPGRVTAISSLSVTSGRLERLIFISQATIRTRLSSATFQSSGVT